VRQLVIALAIEGWLRGVAFTPLAEWKGRMVAVAAGTAAGMLLQRGLGAEAIVASTATIRRYQDQIRGLFDREARQFPPPGLIAGESFFAAEDKTRPGRIFVGICAGGRVYHRSNITALDYLPGESLAPTLTS